MKPRHIIATAALVLSAALIAISGHDKSTYGPGVIPTVPGVANPAVTQETIHDTICKSGWTATVRPPVSYTDKIKNDLAAKLHINAPDYELDHFFSIEIGGAPADPQNLWMEPYNIPLGARQKDTVETYLKNEVCKGELTLAQAQKAVMDWPVIYKAKQGILPVSQDSDE